MKVMTTDELIAHYSASTIIPQFALRAAIPKAIDAVYDARDGRVKTGATMHDAGAAAAVAALESARLAWTELSPQGRMSAHETKSGRTLTDADFEALADDAERVYDATIKPRGVRAEVVAIRMPPELRDAVERRAEREETSVSEVVRAALRREDEGE